jgi:AraC family transcriptional activator of pobA
VMMRRWLCSSVYSYIQMKDVKIHINEQQARIIEADIRLFILHMENPNSQTQASLEGLFATFLADITDIIATSTGEMRVPGRAYDIFTGFTDLLRKDFRKEHSVNYYADKLNISQRYLSMAVKEVSNQSVTFFINQMLMLEACWMLRSTTYNVQEITDHLHFSAATVFCKFFKRHAGISPLAYRDGLPSDMDE